MKGLWFIPCGPQVQFKYMLEDNYNLSSLDDD